MGVREASDVEVDVDVSPQSDPEMGSEEELVICPRKGGLAAETLVVMLFLLTLTESNSEEREWEPVERSPVFSAINLFSHGFEAIQRSNQLQSEPPFLSNCRFLREYAILVTLAGLAPAFGCWNQQIC